MAGSLSAATLWSSHMLETLWLSAGVDTTFELVAWVFAISLWHLVVRSDRLFHLPGVALFLVSDHSAVKVYKTLRYRGNKKTQDTTVFCIKKKKIIHSVANSQGTLIHPVHFCEIGKIETEKNKAIFINFCRNISELGNYVGNELKKIIKLTPLMSCCCKVKKSAACFCTLKMWLYGSSGERSTHTQRHAHTSTLYTT